MLDIIERKKYEVMTDLDWEMMLLMRISHEEHLGYFEMDRIYCYDEDEMNQLLREFKKQLPLFCEEEVGHWDADKEECVPESAL